MSNRDVAFAGAIPALYDRHLGPVIFAPYADDLTRRLLANWSGSRVLEMACGTGVLTRRLDALLPAAAEITATDLNEPMLEHARRATPSKRRIEWARADASALPFEGRRFDSVVCQFGLMFVPDKDAAAREARRVLSPNGRFLFSVWCSIQENPFGRVAHETVSKFFSKDPPTFYQVPFGFHDPVMIRKLIAESGFTDVAIDRVTLELRADSASSFATGLVEGNPISNSIRDAGLAFEAIVEAVTAALVREGGDAPFRSTMNALVVTARAKA
ncbi:MAG: methyltransferase domain-containing protein [Planctomycetes bacterium]|nr:methyltransferase domain-containing protein [Planctomycetota bacterium]